MHFDLVFMVIFIENANLTRQPKRWICQSIQVESWRVPPISRFGYQDQLYPGIWWGRICLDVCGNREDRKVSSLIRLRIRMGLPKSSLTYSWISIFWLFNWRQIRILTQSRFIFGYTMVIVGVDRHRFDENHSSRKEVWFFIARHKYHCPDCNNQRIRTQIF